MDLLADNCHLNPETPELEKSTGQAALDWTTALAGDIWSTVTNREAMSQLGTGAWNYIKDPRGALKDVGIGVVARVARVLDPVNAAGYLLGREAAMLILKGPDAVRDDTMNLVTAPVDGLRKITPAAQVLSNRDSTPAQRAAANTELENAGKNIISVAAMGGGGALGPQELRALASTTASGAHTAAMEIGRVSFWIPPGLEPALITGVRLPVEKIAGIAQGSPSIPVSAAVGEATVVLSQHTGGEGGSDSGKPAPSPLEQNTARFVAPLSWANYQRLTPKLLSKLTKQEQAALDLRRPLTESASSNSLDEVGRALGIDRERVRRLEISAVRKLNAEVESTQLPIRFREPLESRGIRTPQDAAELTRNGIFHLADTGKIPPRIIFNWLRENGVAPRVSPLEQSGLSARAKNRLMYLGIEAPYEVASRFSKEELLNVQGLGKGTVDEIEKWVTSDGSSLLDTPELSPAANNVLLSARQHALIESVLPENVAARLTKMDILRLSNSEEVMDEIVSWLTRHYLAPKVI